MSADRENFADARVGDDDGKKVVQRTDEGRADDESDYEEEYAEGTMKRQLSRKLDLRLCTIAGVLCSLNCEFFLHFLYFCS